MMTTTRTRQFSRAAVTLALTVRRAALMLLLMLLTAQTAWADDHVCRRIIINQPEHGTITVTRNDTHAAVTSGEVLPEGTVVTVNITPDEGYKLKQVTKEVYTYFDLGSLGCFWQSDIDFGVRTATSFNISINNNQEYVISAEIKEAYLLTGQINGSGTMSFSVGNQQNVTAAAEGNRVDITMSDPEPNYSWKVYSDQVDITRDDATHFHFTMPAASVTVSAEVQFIYTITDNSTHGHVVVNGYASGGASLGETVTLTPTPDEGCQYVTNSLTATNNNTGATIPLTDNGNGTWSFTMPESSVTVSAMFAPAYTVHFDGNDALSGTMADQAIASGVATNLSPCTFTNGSWGFLGWSTTPNGSVVYNDGASVTDIAAVGETITLYAQWKVGFIVQFDANGGTGTMADQAIPQDTYRNLTANAFTRTGFEFAFWNTQANGSGTSYADGATVRNLTDALSTVTLYAQWQEKTNMSQGGSINMPVSGIKYVDIPNGVTQFYVNDDGGASGNFTDGCDGQMLLTAPEGKMLKVHGTVTADLVLNGFHMGLAKLTVYDGGSTSSTKLYDNSDGSVPNVTSSGRQMLLHFRDFFVSNETSDGFHLIVEVIDPIDLTPHNINISSSITHGTVTADKTSAMTGETVTLTVTPAVGYELESDYLTGVKVTSIGNNQYTFIMPDQDVTISASFHVSSLFGYHYTDNILTRYFPDGSASKPYKISNTEGWNLFCDCLAEENNTTWNRFSGMTVKLDADISVTRMAGGDYHDFCGTFDGGGHTITLDGNTTNGCYTLFRNVSTDKANPNDTEDTPAAIRNLHVTGTITTASQNAAGLISGKWGNVTIENCRSSVTINSSKSGDGTHGGLVAVNNNGTLDIIGCVFDGKLLTTNGTNACGGFVGRNGGTLNISNSLYAPAAIESGETWVSTTGSATFARNGATINNCYYTRTLGTAQGKAPLAVTAGEGVTIEAVSPVGSPLANGTYSVSGITAYAKGITRTAGSVTTFYYGQGDDVSLTLGNTPAPGNNFSGYTASAGTLSGTSNPYTLTMPASDVTITATWTTDPDFSDNGDGTYTINNATGWGKFCDALANKAKGIFTGKTVKLGDNIGTAENPIARMAGGQYHDFTGTFDGNGKTLIFGYGEANDISTESYIAPFRNVESGCIIENLHVAGDIYTSGQYAAGIICSQYGSVTIRNCRSSINIHSSHGGDGIHGGLVANNNNYAHLTIEGCVFDGKLLTEGTTATNNCGGFVGWQASDVSITNCLYAPAALEEGETWVGTTGSATFARNGATITNSYYTVDFNDGENHTAQGLGYSFASAPANIGTEGTAYGTSGITPYTRGLKYGGLYYMTPEAISLADDAANDVDGINGYFADVTLTGRTLRKDGNWNTLCLPFDVTIADSPLAGDGVDVRRLDEASFSDGTLTLTFTEAGVVTTLSAGFPYIIKWDNTGNNIVSPVFTGVTIENESPADKATTSTYVDFVGTYSPTNIYTAEKTNLYLGAASTLYYPWAEGMTEFNIKACRAYFQLKGGLTAGDPSSQYSVRAFKLKFGEDEPTGIRPTPSPSLNGGEWYDLSGRKLDKAPTRKGLYIHNGQVVIK